MARSSPDSRQYLVVFMVQIVVQTEYFTPFSCLLQQALTRYHKTYNKQTPVVAILYNSK